MYVFLIEDDKFLEKYKIWSKVSISIKQEFYTEPVCNEKYENIKVF